MVEGHRKTDVYGYVMLKWQIADGLGLAGRTQVNSYDIFRDERFPYSATSYGREQAKGDYREDKRTLFENNTDFLLTYGKEISSDLTLKASLGGNLSYRSNYSMTDYLNVPGWYNLANSLNPAKTYNFYALMRVLSGYGYADISFRNFLSLSSTGREDKHSTLPARNNAYFYPSVSLSSVISEVVEMLALFSDLKLRGC